MRVTLAFSDVNWTVLLRFGHQAVYHSKAVNWREKIKVSACIITAHKLISV